MSSDRKTRNIIDWKTREKERTNLIGNIVVKLGDAREVQLAFAPTIADARRPN